MLFSPARNLWASFDFSHNRNYCGSASAVYKFLPMYQVDLFSNRLLIFQNNWLREQCFLSGDEISVSMLSVEFHVINNYSKNSLLIYGIVTS